MQSVFSTYPYLLGSLILLAISAVALLLCPRGQRWPMLLSGLLSMPYAFTSLLFVPAYWDPVRVFELAAGPEDVMFSFANGATAWLLAIWLVRNRLRLELRGWRILLRCAACTAPGLTLTIVWSSRGMPVMTAAIAAMLLVGAVLLLARRQLWPLALAGAAGFAAVYAAVMCALVSAFPRFLLQWNTASLSGISILRVPLEEVAFAAVFGAVWPLLMGFAFEASVVPRHLATSIRDGRVVPALGASQPRGQ